MKILIDCNSLIYNSFLTYFIIFSLDFLLCLILSNKARWFQLHAIINFMILFLIKDDILTIIDNPINSLNSVANRTPGYYAIILHIYHIIHFKNLKLIDYYHHFISAFIAGIPAHLYWGDPLISLWYFFACGLPGGIEYILLVFQKHEYINKLYLKTISSFLNHYIRLPGIMSVITLAYTGYKDNRLNYPFWFIGFIVTLGYLNGTFFAKLAIENNIEYRCNIKNIG